MLLVPFGRRRMLGVVVDGRPGARCRPSGWWSRSRRSSPACRRELVALGLWVAEDYCSTPARGLALVLPPGHRHRHAGAPAAARTRELLVAELHAGGPRGARRPAGRRLGPRQRAALEALGGRPDDGRRARGSARRGARRRSAGSRSSSWWRSSAGRSAGASPASSWSGAPERRRPGSAPRDADRRSAAPRSDGARGASARRRHATTSCSTA